MSTELQNLETLKKKGFPEGKPQRYFVRLAGALNFSILGG
jgi:hypothetical protein